MTCKTLGAVALPIVREVGDRLHEAYCQKLANELHAAIARREPKDVAAAARLLIARAAAWDFDQQALPEIALREAGE